MRLLRFLSAVITFAILTATVAQGQFRERIDVIAVEVPITVRDREGKVPTDLTKDDFEVFENGERQEVIGLSYPVRPVDTPSRATVTIEKLPEAPQRREREPMQILIYLQQSMSGTVGLRKALAGLLDQADALTALGRVEIVTDYPSPRQLLVPTDDVNGFRVFVGNLQRTVAGHEEVAKLRRLVAVETRPGPTGMLPTAGDADPRLLAAMDESHLVRRRQREMLSWMQRYESAGIRPQRLLILVTDGYSIDPLRFYSWVGGGGRRPASRIVSDLRSLTSAPQQSDLARRIASQGWTVYSVVPGALHLVRDVAITEMTYEQAMSLGLPPPFDKLDPMWILKDETGGKVATDVSRIKRDLDELANRLILTYRVHRPRDGKLRRLEIRSRRPGLRVDSQRSVASPTPETLIASRAYALASADGERGELGITCSIREGSGGEVLEIDLDPTPFGAARQSMAAADFRVAVSVAVDKKLPFSDVQTIKDVDLTKDAAGMTIPLKRRGTGRAAVVVEELSTGVWGGCRCQG